MEVHLKIVGSLLMLLSLIHIPFPWYFKWAEELKPLSLMNRQMMQTHTVFIGLTVFLMGLLCTTNANDLLNTALGKKICFGLGIFWFIRLIFQLVVYSTKLWKGKVFETSMHVLFTAFWCYLCWVFGMIYFE